MGGELVQSVIGHDYHHCHAERSEASAMLTLRDPSPSAQDDSADLGRLRMMVQTLVDGSADDGSRTGTRKG